MPLVTVVRSLDTNKIIRQTQILLKIFLCFDGFFTASLICNILALVGVRRWNQWYVMPWLAVYTAFKIFLIACFIYEILYRPFNFGQIFLLFLMMTVMSA